MAKKKRQGVNTLKKSEKRQGKQLEENEGDSASVSDTGPTIVSKG